MDLFLTSKIGATVHLNGKRVAGKIDNRFGFLDDFRKALRKSGRMLYISSTPNSDEKVSDWFEHTIAALAKERIAFDQNILVNGSNAGLLKELVPLTDAIFLSGGHLPTQNLFFQQIGLKHILKDFDGVIVGQSAGSMNCAERVYACPELPGEADDPNFERFRPGLGLTDLCIIPHYNSNHDYILDGKKFYEEVIRPDTFQVPLYVLTDGSYIYERGGKRKFSGEIFLYHQGRMRRVPSSF